MIFVVTRCSQVFLFDHHPIGNNVFFVEVLKPLA